MNLKIIDEDFRLVDIDEVPENYAPISNVVFFLFTIKGLDRIQRKES